MTVTLAELAAYCGALALLVITPGPVVAALIARAATGGVRSVVPLVTGVAVGDIFWPLAAMLGIGVLVALYADILLVLRYGGAAVLAWMGWQMIARAEAAVTAQGDLARESGLAGFAAGLMVIAGNPKAILFYMGVLPGFFRMESLTPADIALICAISALIPFLGNLLWAALFAQARTFLADPVAMRRTHVAAGAALIAVAVAIALG
jgi:threonine/homoserine/homoserine lactone efflux protein